MVQTFISSVQKGFAIERTIFANYLQSDNVPAAQQVSQQVTQQVTRQMSQFLKAVVGDMTRAELMAAVGLKDRVNFSRNYLDPALAQALLEMPQPDSPSSPTQKYRLTEKGKKWRILEQGEEG